MANAAGRFGCLVQFWRFSSWTMDHLLRLFWFGSTGWDWKGQWAEELCTMKHNDHATSRTLVTQWIRRLLYVRVCVCVNMREDAGDLSIWSIGQVRRWGGGFGPWRTQCYGRSVWMTVNHTCERDRRVNFVLAVTGVAYNGTFGNTAITSISVTIKNDRRITGFSVIQFNF